MVGHAADSEAIFVAQENDLSLDGHKGKQFNSEIARKYDLILVMDKGHIEQISKTVPEARGKTMLLGYWLGDKEIPDPYRKSTEAFIAVYKLIDQACEAWVSKLKD